MSKHDFHIALVLLALIAAGTLGYQSLNAESTYVPGKCTLALYFSSIDGCNSSDAIDTQPPPVLDGRLHSTAKPEEIGLIEIDDFIEGERSHRRIGWSEKMSVNISFEPDSMPGVKPEK